MNTKTAPPQALEDRDAAQLKRLYPKLHDHITKRIEQGFTPEHVEQWLDMWYGWHEKSNIRTMCINAAKSIYREHQQNIPAGTK